MPYTVNYNKLGFVVLKYTGVVTQQEAGESSVEGIALAKMHGVQLFLADHSDATLEPAHDFFTAAPWVSRFINTLPGRDAGDGGFAARLRRLS